VDLMVFAKFTGVDLSVLFEASLIAAEVAGEAGRLARVKAGLGDIALERSDHEGARARYEEALPLYRQVGSVRGEANCIQGLGDIALRRSDHEGARAPYAQANTL
jgi:predicted negative regulator of RcsB-dependent stress response